MKLLVLAVLLPLVYATIPADVSAGYMPGQTNNVILRPQTIQQGADAVFTVIDESGQFVDTSRPISEIASAFSAYDVANIVAQTLGFTPLHHNTAAGIFSAKTNLFVRPRANLLLTIDSIGLRAVSDLKLSALSSQRLSAPYVHLSQVFYPANINNLAAALSSGRAPSQYFSSSPNLADAVNSAFHAQSLFVAASGKASVASSFAPRSIKSSRTHVLSFKENSMSEIASSPLEHTVSQLLAAISTPSTSSVWSYLEQNGIRVTVSGNTATVSMGQSTVHFDLSSPVDAALFAELQFIASLPSGISTHMQSAVQDDTPDVFALTIASLTDIAQKYGASSVQFQTAAMIVDASVPFIISQFSALYPQRMVAEIVLSGSVTSEPNAAEVIAAVNSVLAQNQLPQVQSLNNIVGPTSASALDTLCAAINTAVAPFHFTAYCPHPVKVATQSHMRVMATSNDDDPSNNCYSSQDPYPNCAAYQISMWVGIMLAMAVFASVYGVLYMDLKRDTLLYSKFNPTSQRKNQ